MARLKSRHKRFVVRRLAVFDRPKEVRSAVNNRFGLEVSLQQLQHYDPTTEKGSQLASDLENLFWETRQEFIEDQKGIALAHKSKRLRELEKQYYRLGDLIENLPENNVMHQADLQAERREVLEQIAKELGGKFTRKQLLELMGEDGGPIETEEKGGGMQFFVPEEQDEDDLRPSANGDPASTNGQAEDE
jgi:hypothetical protein